MGKDTIFFNSRRQNKNYLPGLVNPVDAGSASFLSNIHDNSEISQRPFIIKTEPKWLTELVNKETGEVYTCTDFSSAAGRKYKVVNDFCATYSATYRKHEVSLLFHTFTAVNLSNYDGISGILNPIKYRYESIQRPLLGYVWVLECSRNLHVHYHLCTAVNRLTVKKIPNELKFEGLWGARTGVEFVKGDVNSYMQKKALGGYLSKHAHLWERYQVRRGVPDKLSVMRMCGKSQVFKLPVKDCV